MAGTTVDFSVILTRLAAFKRRLYLNLLLRGSMLGATLLLSAFLTFTFLEYFLYLPYWGRATLLFGFLGATGYALVRWVWEPLLGFLQLRRLLTDARRANVLPGTIRDQLRTNRLDFDWDR